MMVKNRKEAVHTGIELLEAEIDKFMKSLNLCDATKMELLEQSARYLGVYVANEPSDQLDGRFIN